jgi:proteasome accessory factor A
MQESLFGVETEYAFTHFGPGGKALDRSAGLERMFQLAHRQLKCLPDAGAHGVFLSNGSRLYIDVGQHPELSTPECSDPWEAVRYILAGERILTGLASELDKGRSGSKASIYRCNVDYVTGQTWGCHESYLHRARPEALAEEIIPHLVSRLVYTGAGGFDNHSSGLAFMLSPRVPHLVKKISGESTRDRGIFHTKDEPLCKKRYHRLHILCGESQCSQLGTFLKLGATALVVRLIEAGVCKGREVALRSPLASMRRFSTDPSCTRREALQNGRKLSALEIQRHYLEAAESHASSSFMPPWAGEVCAEWRRMLDRLKGGAEAVPTMLDWGIKLALYRQHARKHGFQWDELPGEMPPIESVAEALRRPEPGPRASRQEWLFPEDHLPHARARRAALRASRPARLEELGPFLPLRAELFEIDTRFGELGASGIFTALDQAGVLDHRLPGLRDVEEAVDQPPARGRAHERGEAILRHCGEPRRYSAGWQGIFDHQLDRRFDLSDPFGGNPSWTQRKRGEDARSNAQLLRFMRERRAR